MKFSIIVPFHNAEATLRETLHGLQAQTYPNWEAICVNDRSRDGSVALVQDMARHDPRISMVDSPKQGPSVARNFGAALATGEVLAFCDADDIWTSDKLVQLNATFQDRGVDGTYGRIMFFQSQPSDGKTQSTVPAASLTIPMLLAENPVCTMSNLSARRTAFLSAGGLATDLVHNEDLEFLIRFVGLGHRIVGLDRLQVWYRTSPTGLSSDLAAMHLGRQSALRTAQSFGFAPTVRDEAVFLRYMARRALRLDARPTEALQLVWQGIRLSPSGFLLPLHRGLATACASAVSLVLPTTIRQALFCR